MFSLTELQGHASIFIPNFRHFRALTKKVRDETRVEAVFQKHQKYVSVGAGDAEFHRSSIKVGSFLYSKTLFLKTYLLELYSDTNIPPSTGDLD